ncbi:alpha/beta-hydrolase [Conidiobolus coronatus NRRL 28638]|uniref:Alpha/beta-hydrolase n=1 Tax=Conidiobolus coronatus (strain ATCC 28846 / CBS 209.66 / NRRL 28638) TaxID=796925 RepID=A0A137PHM6_CONC2|nr:alpha/beta-hydrolase [Conidiobolus coronatus NRRL 28638]|eukprot:KXN74482.1 alpha/beta-hydrolase [Conidiobolus coronatus NRRL 28638]
MNFLNYAAATYCSQKEIEKWNCYNCQGFGKNTKDVVHASYDKLKSTAFTGVNHEKKIIVAAYRGTSNLDNWIINLKFGFIPLKANDTSSVKIHQGFSEAADVLLYKMRPAILMAMKKNPTYKVVFTGHSLGGALATLSAVKFAEEGLVNWDRIQLITFGQPRVGNLAFADYLDSKPIESARVTTRGDIVPIVPGHMLGYYHSQHIVHMDMKGNPIECSSTQEDPNCFRYFKELTLDAHFTYFNQRLNSNCQDPRTIDPRNWFQRTRDSVVGWWKEIWKKWF